METILRNPLHRDIVVICTTVGVFALITYLYFKLEPIVVIPPESIVADCPTRWLYDVDAKECRPTYSTKCKGFDPTKYSVSEKCDIAKSCGTSWKGLCGF